MTNSPTKLLSLDLGEKRIGIGLSDALRIVAQPYDVFPRTSRKADFDYVRQIVERENVGQIVVGLPITMSGEEGAMAQWARDYGTDLGHTLNIPVTFWDESLTSMQAERSMREYGMSRKQMKKKVDAVAAALILQSYLESLRE